MERLSIPGDIPGNPGHVGTKLDSAVDAKALLAGLSFGFEEEYLLLDASGQVAELPFEALIGTDGPSGMWSPEAHIGMLEHSSPVFHNAREQALHLRRCRDFLTLRLDRLQLQLFVGGAHPTLDWREMAIRDCYRASVDELQELLRQLFTFGMHCHIGSCPEPWLSRLFNALRPFLAPLIALCANSRMYAGRDTGLASYRCAALGQLPRGGTPPEVVSFESELEAISGLLSAGLIHKPTCIWTDARLHPVYRTIEIRVMDMQPAPMLASSVATLCALLATELLRGLLDGEQPLSLADWQLRENRWQAVRHGMAARFFWQGEMLDARRLWQQWLLKLAPLFSEQRLEAEFACLAAYIESD